MRLPPLPQDIWLFVIAGYVFLLNFMVLGTPLLFVFGQLSLLMLVYAFYQDKAIVQAWLPFVAFVLLFEFIRGYSENLSPFYPEALNLVYHIETAIWGRLPSEVLQQIFADNMLVFWVSFLFYTSYFYYSFVVAIVLWVIKRELFEDYVRGFMLLCVLGLVTFILLPTAPPWMVAKEYGLQIVRVLYERIFVIYAAGSSSYNYFVAGNLVAAFPSFHAAWPMFSSLFLIKYLKAKWRYWLLIMPLMIGFSVILNGEHYVVDVLAGYGYAYLAVTILDLSLR